AVATRSAGPGTWMAWPQLAQAALVPASASGACRRVEQNGQRTCGMPHLLSLGESLSPHSLRAPAGLQRGAYNIIWHLPTSPCHGPSHHEPRRHGVSLREADLA